VQNLSAGHGGFTLRALTKFYRPDGDSRSNGAGKPRCSNPGCCDSRSGEVLLKRLALPPEKTSESVQRGLAPGWRRTLIMTAPKTWSWAAG
jgi:hypothetical protein